MLNLRAGMEMVDCKSPTRARKVTMSSNDYVPSNDLIYKQWLANFAAKCETYETLVNFNVEQLAAVNAQNTAFATAMDDLEEAKLAYQNAVQAKDSARKSSVALARAYAKQIKGTPGVTPAIQSDFGILSNSTVGPVVVVSGLNITGCDDGVNMLKWDRTGNANGTMFLIESSLNGQTGWELVDVTTKVTYDHIDQIPGQRQFYRIRSKRGNTTSQACPPEVVYANGGEGGLSLAA
jgi:hypothetical protein